MLSVPKVSKPTDFRIARNELIFVVARLPGKSNCTPISSAFFLRRAPLSSNFRSRVFVLKKTSTHNPTNSLRMYQDRFRRVLFLFVVCCCCCCFLFVVCCELCVVCGVHCVMCVVWCVLCLNKMHTKNVKTTIFEPLGLETISKSNPPCVFPHVTHGQECYRYQKGPNRLIFELHATNFFCCGTATKEIQLHTN